MNIDLRTGGPHSPAYTKKVGDALAECVRVLNYASSGNAGGLEYPGDAYTLLGALYTATERMPQLLGQLSAFLEAQAATGRLEDDHGRDVAAQAMLACSFLSEASARCGGVDRMLRDAQNAIAGLYVAEGKSGTDGSKADG